MWPACYLLQGDAVFLLGIQSAAWDAVCYLGFSLLQGMNFSAWNAVCCLGSSLPAGVAVSYLGYSLLLEMMQLNAAEMPMM